ncbi:sialidase family protein [Porphyromonas loveana]|uniref:sialidase family protein n=1 Tax=Porphyromonas loveana TaxID=1884669 RepID=UPI00359F6B1A
MKRNRPIVAYSQHISRLKFLLLLCISVCSITILRGQDAIVRGERHGTAPNQVMRTLATVSLFDPMRAEDSTIEIRYELPKGTARRITRLQLLSSDSLAIRDLPDYRGRITYNVHAPIAEGTFRLTGEDVAGKRHFYIVADIDASPAHSQRDTLDIRVTDVLRNGLPLKKVEHQGETSRRIFRGYEALFVPGDDGSRNYRIPAILRTHNGTLIAVADKRKYNQGDLPEDIDIVLRRSEDGGETWSPAQTVIQGQGRGLGYGDAALVQTHNGRILMFFVGGIGMWQSTAEQPIRTYLCESTDDGRTWSTPRDITPSLFGAECSDEVRRHFLASFVASGQGLVLPNGRILFAAAMRENNNGFVLHNYILYSDDDGATWQVSDKAFARGDEAKLSLLPDGRILLSVRNQGGQEEGQRFFAISEDSGHSWTRTRTFEGIPDNGCNGAVLQVEHHGRKLMLHSLPGHPTKRVDGVIYVYDHDKSKWSHPLLINGGMSAYSDMTMIDKDTLAYFVEEDATMSLVLIRLSLDELLSDLTF